MTEESRKTLVHALVTSRLYYRNALLYGLPQTVLQRLQKVQNCAARLITRTRKHEHTASLLQRFLHWLPVHLRPIYIRFTYGAINGLVPDYLAELISYRPINRTLQSASLPALLFVPTSRLSHMVIAVSLFAQPFYGTISFTIRTEKSLQVFKTLLKTKLFKQVFL